MKLTKDERMLAVLYGDGTRCGLINALEKMSQGDLGLCQRLYVRYKSGVKNCNTKDEDKLRYELRLKLGSVRLIYL